MGDQREAGAPIPPSHPGSTPVATDHGPVDDPSPLPRAEDEANLPALMPTCPRCLARVQYNGQTCDNCGYDVNAQPPAREPERAESSVVESPERAKAPAFAGQFVPWQRPTDRSESGPRSRLWRWVKNADDRVLGAVGGVFLAAVLVAGWAIFDPGPGAADRPAPQVKPPVFPSFNRGEWIEKARTQADQDAARLWAELPQCKARFEVDLSTLSGPFGASVIVTGIVASRADERNLREFVGSLKLQTRVEYELAVAGDD